MSDYKRLVSYIFSYNNGQKDKNVGFAKIEIKNGQCKIQISLKGVYTKTPENFGVYFAIRKKDGIAGIKLGEITVKNGLGEFGDTTFPGNIKNTGHVFSDISGLFIGNKNDRNSILLSIWDDEEIPVSSLLFSEEIKPVSVKPVNTEEEPRQEQKESGLKDALEEEQREEEVNNIAKENLVEAAEKESSKETEQRGGVLLKERSDETMQEDQQESGEETDEASLLSEDIQTGANGLEDLLQELFSRNSKIDAFNDDDFYDCVEICPDDLKKLPLSEFNVNNNSFLMHGYYGYRHILFGRVQRNKEKNLYFIGVPGLYSNREKYMSSMFGFRNFKKSHRSDYRNPYFGYWYTEIYL